MTKRVTGEGYRVKAKAKQKTFTNHAHERDKQNQERHSALKTIGTLGKGHSCNAFSVNEI